MSQPVDDPLKFTYLLGPDLAIVTVVQGFYRNSADVSIVIDNVVAWSGTLSPVAPEITLPDDVVSGGTMVVAGSSFLLDVPGQGQAGAVGFNGLYIAGGGPKQRFEGFVAQWPLPA